MLCGVLNEKETRKRVDIYICFPGGTLVKNVPAMQEMQEIWVQSLGWEDPLEQEMATHSSILAWEIPWGSYSPWVAKTKED